MHMYPANVFNNDIRCRYDNIQITNISTDSGYYFCLVNELLEDEMFQHFKIHLHDVMDSIPL